jgi:hypothetical protein
LTASLPLAFGHLKGIVTRNVRFILSVGREPSKKLERSTGGLDLCFDRSDSGLPRLIVGWSYDRWGVGINEWAGFGV